MGRPSSLTPQRKKALLKLLASGMPIIHACKRVGIGYDTYAQWRRKGQEPDRDGRDRYVKFFKDTEAIKDKALELACKTMYTGLKEDYAFALKWAQSRYPKQYAPSRVNKMDFSKQPPAQAVEEDPIAILAKLPKHMVNWSMVPEEFWPDSVREEQAESEENEED